MRTYHLLQVDAFTHVPLGGNPCAVVLGADDLNEATMQAIAREMNLSETAFVMRSDVADFRARYFTPGEEIPLAGHPTLAVVHSLIQTGTIPLSGEPRRISLELQAGVIYVDIVHDRAQGRQIIMTQRIPRFMNSYDAADILPVFGLMPSDAIDNVPIQTVSTGTPQLMIPLRDLETLGRVQVDGQGLAKLREIGDFFSVHLFTPQGVTARGDTFARHFAAPPDVLEDPFTGSATGGMGVYLWHHGLIDAPHFIAEQGHWLGRPGHATVEVLGPRNAPENVRVGGQAVTVIRGELFLP
jgi:trans-2,3-dihydro-3-hydroxyanthranilate isomerase